MNRTVQSFFCVLLSLSGIISSAFAASNYEQDILNPRFKTLKVEKEDDFFGIPDIRLGSSDRIIISFDELADDYSQLRYRLIHCNADWTPSSLVEAEYLNGFNEGDIDDYAFSANTFVNYVNYRFAIPSENMQPIVSGNYIAEVFPQDNPEEIILRARFSVNENSAVIAGKAHSKTDNGFNSQWQQLYLSVDPGIQNINPYSDIFITATQNRRPDTEHIISHPLRVVGSEIIYDHLPELIFPAGNEYRRFETVRTDYPGMNIEAIDFENRTYHAWVAAGYPRSGRQYHYDHTQRGRFKIDDYNSTDPDLGADYVSVHFTLDHPELIDGDIYVEGDLTNHAYNRNSKMEYDRESGLYTLTLLLKQGSYNYQYVVRKRNDNARGTASLVEGDYYETINEYNVKVWLRLPAARADRLLGSTTLVSHE